MVKVVVGANWGNEGKGKMTDLLAIDSDIVVRFQSGANAGHTIITDKGRFALYLLPSGVFYKHITNVIAQGVALDLAKFFAEYDELCDIGIKPNILISDRAQILLPHHILFDKLEEERLGDNSFGSTNPGIAPFYSDKFLKVGIQVCELFDPSRLLARLEPICEYKSLILKAVYRQGPIDVKALHEYLIAFANRIKPFVTDTSQFLNNAIKEGKSVLMEGQLGALLDPDHGVYPYTASSSALAGNATVGVGISPCAISNVICVAKSYSSYVGASTFISEIVGDEAEELRKRGDDRDEYGGTTGRPGRVGWLDLVATRYGCMVQGATNIALTFIDVLGYLEKIPVCVAYEIDGKIINDFPCTPQLEKAKPVYEYLDGWNCDIRDVTEWENLPVNTQRYIAFIEERLGYPITYISTGPQRESIVYR